MPEMKGTIKSNDEISFLFNVGKRINTTNMIALVSADQALFKKKPENHGGRIAVIAGKRLGSVPQRNRAKRRIREAARLAQAPWSGFDVVLIAREAILQADFTTIVKDMNKVTTNIRKTTDRGSQQ